MEIQDRTLKFAIKTAKFVKSIARDLCLDVLLKQLLRSATSVGANMREADSASSKKDFINKVVISKKEAQETEYWLELLRESGFIHNLENKKELNALSGECREIIKILATIMHKAKGSLRH